MGMLKSGQNINNQEKNIEIVIVDDDKIVLDALKTLFEIEGIKNALFFNSSIEAYSFLKHKKNKPKVVISDFIMPKLNGIEFLTKVKALYDDISLILLTGYADKENAIKAINELGIYKYIEKPWDNDNLILNIKNAIERSELISKLKNKVIELDEANKKLEKYNQDLETIIDEKTKSLNEVNTKLNAIFDNCADSIVLINKSGKISRINQEFEALTGLAKKIILKKNINDFICSTKLSIKKKISETIDKEKNVIVRDYEIKNKINGNVTPLEISIAPIYIDNNYEYILVIRDISVQKKMEKLRDDFIATLTHDLRTPLLASIQTLSYLIDGTLGELNDKQMKFLTTMKSTNCDMLGLVNALLEVYRYEEGKLNLYKENFGINEFIENINSQLESLYITKKINVKLLLSKTQGKNMYADKNEIRRVLVNLCGNAVKFSKPDGEIIIKTDIMNENDLKITVEDRGEGISKEELPQLFNRFMSFNDSGKGNVKNINSSGLGLYLSKKIVEAHNGKIWVESIKGQGSKFSILLVNCLNVINSDFKLEEKRSEKIKV